MVVFNVFKLYKWYQIAQRITKLIKLTANYLAARVSQSINNSYNSIKEG